MSQYNQLKLSERVRAFRRRNKLSQEELAKLLGVSGNYISMIEMGKKSPGTSLLKLFESHENSLPQAPAQASDALHESLPGAATDGTVPACQAEAQKRRPATSLFFFSQLSTDTLHRTFAELAEKLSRLDPPKQKHVIGNLRELLNELERRLLAGTATRPDP